MEELAKETCGAYFAQESPLAEESTYDAGNQCFHAVGHAVLFALESNVEGSVAVCMSLPYEWMRNWCGVGIFMEVTYLLIPEYHPESPRPFTIDKDMASFCAHYEGLRSQCNQFVGRVHLIRHPEEYAESFLACEKLGFEVDRSRCRHATYLVMITGAGVDFDTMYSRCSAAGPTYENECLLYVGRSILSGYAGERARSRFVSYCASMKPELRQSCLALDPLR